MTPVCCTTALRRRDQRCLSQIPALLEQLGDLGRPSIVSWRSRNHGSLPLPHPCLGFGNVGLQLEKWSIFQAYFGKVGFVEWVMGLELSPEYCCFMWGGTKQVFQRSLLWSLGSSWKNLTFYNVLSKPLPTWPWTLPGMGKPQLPWETCFATLTKMDLFLISNFKPPCVRVEPFPLSLSLHALLQNPSPALPQLLAPRKREGYNS